MTELPGLVGMIHLHPLPGSSKYRGSINEVTDAALSDGSTLEGAGFHALMIENFGDAPFYADRVPPETVASMATVADRVRQRIGLPVGINVLRNDALAALGVAAAVSAAMIRVNVLTGTMYTDQGPIVGRSAEVARVRQHLAPDTQIWADVMVKHAVPPPGLTLEIAAADLRERGGAEAVIISGRGSGDPVDPKEGLLLRETLGNALPIVIGSGASVSNLDTLAQFADVLIVGSALKPGGRIDSPVDRELASRFAQAAEGAGFVQSRHRGTD